MKISRQLIRLGAICLVILFGFSGSSFVKAPKETLKEIALRKQSEGKFIPVYIHPMNLIHKGVSVDASAICSAGSKAQPIKDQFGNDYYVNTIFEERIPESYFIMSESIANQLNEGFGTTAFKPVYAKDIPMKDIKLLGREDKLADWWQTEYDIVMNITANLMYVTRSAAEMTSHLEFSSMMYVNTVEPGKQALGNMGMGMNLGSIKSDVITHGSCISSLDELQSEVAEVESLATSCGNLGEDAVAKFIDRENKKYEKAMKKKK